MISRHSAPLPDRKSRESAPFGTACASTMLVQHCADGTWTPPELVPYGDLGLSPMTRALHYGQSVFEGMKGFRLPDGRLSVFRMRDHLERLNHSARRMCMPEVDVEALGAGIRELIRAEAASVPDAPGFLYVRPLYFAESSDLHPLPASRYALLVLLSPGEAIYDPDAGLIITTMPDFTRAAAGGTGTAKCAGNYAGALLAREEARRRGFDEVLWLDPREKRFAEETGTMNLMLVRRDRLVTPALTDSILAGITRDTLLQLGREVGIPVEEAPVPVTSSFWSEVSEVFASGTAAGTAHVREVHHRNERLFARTEPGPIARRLGRLLDESHRGERHDPLDWRAPFRARPPLEPAWLHG